MKVSNSNGKSTVYPKDTIQSISFHKAIEIFSMEDCAGNEVLPDEVIMLITFKDGTSASFTALNWYITNL